jgi:hypothetical protein
MALDPPPQTHPPAALSPCMACAHARFCSHCDRRMTTRQRDSSPTDQWKASPSTTTAIESAEAGGRFFPWGSRPGHDNPQQLRDDHRWGCGVMSIDAHHRCISRVWVTTTRKSRPIALIHATCHTTHWPRATGARPALQKPREEG